MGYCTLLNSKEPSINGGSFAIVSSISAVLGPRNRTLSALISMQICINEVFGINITAPTCVDYIQRMQHFQGPEHTGNDWLDDVDS
jgi:hypothetical protein